MTILPGTPRISIHDPSGLQARGWEKPIVSIHATYYICLVFTFATNVRPRSVRCRVCSYCWLYRQVVWQLTYFLTLFSYKYSVSTDWHIWLDGRLMPIDGFGTGIGIGLVHVCWRWRFLIFSWPKFLDLNLVCGPATRVGLTAIWLLLPIIIRN
jgi:hypothetical protein